MSHTWRKAIPIATGLLCWLAGACLAGCGGGTATPPAGEPTGHWGQATPSPHLARSADDVADLTPIDGTPGLDYAPDVIEVGYLADAVLPDYLAGRPAPDQTAAAQANAILRENTEYEVLTDAIATRYGLTIRTQVYMGACNFAAFDVPPAVDGPATLSRLRREFAPVLACAGFTPLATAQFVPDDPDFTVSTSSTGPQWGHRRINCQTAWDYTRGDPELLIGVVDTGCRLYHEELEGQVLDPAIYFPDIEMDLINHDNTVEDEHSHGTRICGLVAAKTDNGRTIAGVAGDCRIIPVKIANTTASALYTDMAAGCLLAAQLGARVVNLSWTGYSTSSTLRQAVDELADRGVLLVVAAGNNDTDAPGYPAAYDNCLSVGATGNFDIRLEFSNYGNYVDIAAPGTELKSSTIGGIADYADCEGTSFSAPLVAAAAALLWTVEPTLSLPSVRHLLESTGAETFDFDAEFPVRRLDIGAALADTIGIQAPRPDQLVFSDTVVLEPVPSANTEQVELYVNGEMKYTRTAAPWVFNLDLSSYGYTILDIEFHAVKGEIWAVDHLPLFVDNTSGLHSLNETFDDPVRFVYGLDARQHSDALFTALKQADPGGWTPADVREQGPAAWSLATPGYLGSIAARVGETGQNHGAFETDVLITPRINLVGTISAEFAFRTRANLAGDNTGWLLYTSDYGQTFSRLEVAGQPDSFSGYQADFTQYTYDLSGLFGQKVHFVFLLETGADTAGVEAGEDATWWIDDITLSGSSVRLQDAEIVATDVPGAITGTGLLNVTASGPENVLHVNYWLDFPPLGVLDAYDIQKSSATAPFASQFNIMPMFSTPNQKALLRILPIGASEFAGEELTRTVYLWNHYGDVNCDGTVDEADSAAYGAVLGINKFQPGFEPFFDTDRDGVITEQDAAAVGYYYSSGE